MFAFAVYKKSTNTLYLVRDRLGMKPLYYYQDDKAFLFSSELKSFFKFPGFRKKISKSSLNLFLCHGYITAPNSIFENTFKLEPGASLEFDLSTQEITEQRFWSIQDVYRNRAVTSASEESVVQDFDDLLTEAVEYRMVSDVPIGAFLSGGYDSSLVSAVMQKLSPHPVDTFTIGFEDAKFDEAQYAKRIAGYLGTSHHELYLPMGKVEGLIETIPEYYDEPFADSSQLPTMLVSKFAREKVTVSLSGDGGDELFCGYGRYDGVLKYQKYKILGVLSRLLGRCIGETAGRGKLLQMIQRFKALDSDNNIINYTYLNCQPLIQGLVLDGSMKLDNRYFDILDLSQNIQEKYMLQDIITYLPDDILTKVDRASMAYSLEARLPLLDYRVVEFSMNVPHGLKYKDGKKKYLLKKLAHRYIPQDLLDRPKHGFGIPVTKWLKNDLKYLVEKHLNLGTIAKQGVFDPIRVQQIVVWFLRGDKGPVIDRLVWHLMVFQMWYAMYMDNDA
jgi:asparagine synthase (glutamine-hydrolysing)